MDSEQPLLTKTSPVQVAIAILYCQNRYLMQLRDNIPGIVYPGCWGLFGGHIEPGETPAIAVKRELAEEIGYVANPLFEFDRYRDHRAVRHIFHGPLMILPEELILKEGWDLDLLTPTAICAGQHYSAQARQTRPLGDIHQRILLDFIKFQSGESA